MSRRSLAYLALVAGCLMLCAAGPAQGSVPKVILAEDIGAIW